jgi:hypothetical protein
MIGALRLSDLRQTIDFRRQFGILHENFEQFSLLTCTKKSYDQPKKIQVPYQ